MKTRLIQYRLFLATAIISLSSLLAFFAFQQGGVSTPPAGASSEHWGLLLPVAVLVGFFLAQLYHSFSKNRIHAVHAKPESLSDLTTEEDGQNQDVLIANKTTFQNMADAAPFLIWQLDPNGNALYLNRATKDFSGKGLEAPWQFSIYPDDEAEVERTLNKAIRQKTPFQNEVRTLNATGEYRWLLSMASPQLDRNGELVGFIGCSIDIHERKMLEHKLQISEERFRLAMENTAIGMSLVSLDGRWLKVNKALSELLGYTTDEFLGLTWQQLTHPDDLNMDLAQVNRTLNGEIQNYQMEKRYFHKSGVLIWGQLHVSLVRDQEQKPLYFVSQILDITERKRAREELEKTVAQRTDALQQSTKLLGSIIENVPSMIFMKDAKELRFVLFNKTAESISGFSQESMLGKNDYDFFPKEQADFFTQSDRKTLTQNRQLNIEEEPIKTQSGEIRYLHTKKVPILDETGEPLYLLGISEDITEAKASQEKIASLNRQLQEQVCNLNALNKEMEAFSYSVSHDLRTPLRTIDGFSQAILDMYADKLDARGVNYLQRLRKGSQQMGHLIDDMLSLSRLTRSEMHIEDNIDLSQIARDIAAELQQQAPERNVEFQIADNLWAKGDQRLLHAALQNLLDNAWKYSSKHSSAHIEFGATQEADRTVYYVKDDGAGFDMAYADKLFGAFQRLHHTSEFAGTGIGLAIVQRIIHRHGGHIWAKAVVEQGATFYFTLHADMPPMPLASQKEEILHGDRLQESHFAG